MISKARGEINIELDDYVNNLDATTRAEGEKAAKTWLDAIKAAQQTQQQLTPQSQTPSAKP